MNAIHYIGFDVHKKTISFCVKTADGQIVGFVVRTLKGQDIEGTDEVTTIRRTTLRVFGGPFRNNLVTDGT